MKPIIIIKNFFKGHERSVTVKKNILASFGIKIFSIIISLSYVPLLLDYLDKERYGIWLTLSSILLWSRFFDIGLGNGLRNKFAEAIALGNTKLAKEYVSTTYAVLSIIFVVVLIIFFIVNPFLNWSRILNTYSSMKNELSYLALIAFTFFVLNFIFKLIQQILLADQRTAISNSFGPIGNFMSLIIIFILTKTTTHGSLLTVGSIISSVPVLLLLFSSIYFFRGDYKKYKPSLQNINFQHSRALMSLGGKFFIIQIAGIIIFSTSNFIIARIFGPSEVTPYNIAFKLFNIPIMVYVIIMSPFWSAFTEAYTKEDYAWIKRTMKKLNLLSIVFVLGIICLLFTSNILYKIWLGNRIQIPFNLSLVMAFYALIIVVLSPYTQFINGVSKLKLSINIVWIKALLFIPLAILLSKTSLGICGIMLATCILNFTGIVMEPLQYNKIINRKAYGIWNK